MSQLPALLQVMRPYQWSKNVLVFLPCAAAQDFSFQTVFFSFIAFVSFSLTASAVYILNDIRDLRSDQLHPTKKNRAFASGNLKVAFGLSIAPFFIGAALISAVFVSPLLALVLLGYFLSNLLYTLVLKKMLLVDIFVLASFYATRVLAGSYASGIEISSWLINFSLFFFFSLAGIKRAAELLTMRAHGVDTPLGRGYTSDDYYPLLIISSATAVVSILVLGLYLNSNEVLSLYQSPQHLWLTCLILSYWIARILLITNRGEMNDDPVLFAVRDRTSWICLLLCILSVLLSTFA